MTRERLELLFELARELYAEKQTESGMITPIPFAWALDSRDNAMILFSAWERDARVVAERVGCSAFGEPAATPSALSQETGE
jgi:hypothetical protein